MKSEKKISRINDQGMAYAGLVIAVLLWSINTVLARGVVNQINPMTLSFWRWVFALIFLLPISFKYIKNDIHSIRKNLAKILILSFFSVAVYNSVLYFAAGYTTATNMSFAIATLPVMTIIVAMIIVREIPSKIQAIGIIISSAGMATIVFKGALFNNLILEFNYGDIMTAGAIFSWSIYSVLMRKFRIAIHPLSFLTATIFFGILFIFPFYTWEILISSKEIFTSSTIPIFMFVGFFPSIISYMLWNNGVLKVGPSKSAIFLYLSPVFAIIPSIMVLGESIFLYHIFGGILIFCGLYLSIKR